MVCDIVDDAIAAHKLLEQVLEQKVVASSCDEHRKAQRFISSYIVANSMEEFPAIAYALKTGRVFADDLLSEIPGLGAITEEDHCRSFRYAMRHAYAGDATGVDRAVQQALYHMDRWHAPTPELIKHIRSLCEYEHHEKETRRTIYNADEDTLERLDTLMYLHGDPVCAQRYVAGLCDAVRTAFTDLDRPAAALAHIRDAVGKESSEDFVRFCRVCYYQNV